MYTRVEQAVLGHYPFCQPTSRCMAHHASMLTIEVDALTYNALLQAYDSLDIVFSSAGSFEKA